MSGTLLSGVNIMYSGNPLSDLSLSAFLDKFMEKKPKQSTWHGASQIEPAKKIDMMNHQLIGPGILSLAEADVPPEDIVFHKFYMNKMNSSKKPKKKKKKAAEDEAAEELYAVDGNDDESDDEEIDSMLDSVGPSSEADGDYDYEDLDKIADEDDEDLIGEGSDEEIVILSDNEAIEDGEAGITMGDGDDVDDNDDDDAVAIGEADDGFEQGKKKRKLRRGSGVSPFASLEDYQHLMEADDPDPDASPEKMKKKKSKKNKKNRKLS